MSVPRQSQMPAKKQIVFATSGQTAAVITSAVVGGLVGGAIAAAVSAGATADERQLILARLQQTNTDPDVILANEWERQIRAEKFYPVIPSGGDAEFRFQVESVGFMGSGRKLYPVLTGEAKLVRRDGHVLWAEFVQSEGTDNRLAMIGHSFDEYMRSDAVLRESFEKAAQVFCRDAISMFREQYRDATRDDEDLRRDLEDREWKNLSKDERQRRRKARDEAEKHQEVAERDEEKAREQAAKREIQQAKAERKRLESERRAGTR